MRNSLDKYMKQVDRAVEDRRKNNTRGKIIVHVVPEFYHEMLDYVHTYYPTQGILIQRQEEIHVRQ